MFYPTNSTVTAVNGDSKVTFVEEPNFGVVKILPPWAVPQIDAAVKDFIETSHLPEGIDKDGFYYQTLEAIAGSTVLGGAGDFWMATIGNRVVVYGLAHISKDLDHKLCYSISQMWVAKDFRGKPIVKKWWEQIRQRAKDCFCRHLVITSSRNPEAYIRFLGHGMRKYCTMLKEEI